MQSFFWNEIIGVPAVTTFSVHWLWRLVAAESRSSFLRYHHVFLSEWRDRYPEAELYTSPGLKVKWQHIAFDSELLATDAYPWSDAIAHTIFGPSRLFDEVVFFHRSSGTLILTDLIVNAKTDSYNLFQKLFFAFDGLSYPNGGTPRLYRWSIKSKNAANGPTYFR